MLLKIIKHDFAFASRLFARTNAVILATGGLLWVIGFFLPRRQEMGFIPLETQLLGMLFTGALIFAAVQLYRMYNALFFRQSGYLMLTLPVKRSAQLFSKYVVAIAWALVTLAALYIAGNLAAAHNPRLSVMSMTNNYTGETITGINLISPLLHLTAVGVVWLTILFFVATLENSAFGARRVGGVMAAAAGVGCGLAFNALFNWLQGQWYAWYIPIGDWFLDVPLMLYTLLAALAFAGVTHWLLCKKIALR